MKSVTVSIVSPSIYHEVMGPDPMIFVFRMLRFKLVFLHSSPSLHQEALQFLLTFCHSGGVTCISEVIDVSPSNLDSSLCFSLLMIKYMLTNILSSLHPYQLPCLLYNFYEMLEMNHSHCCFSSFASIYKLEFLLSLKHAFKHQYDVNF